MKDRQEKIAQVIVTAQQMHDIEERIFTAGMPVVALMEKVAGLIARRIQDIYLLSCQQENKGKASLSPSLPPSRVGILTGPGHNGGDALVVARELYFRGYEVLIYCPFSKLKELTSQHLQYNRSLGLPCYDSIEPLQDCDLLIDGLFGFGLERTLTDPVASAINQLNEWDKPIISIDLPSGLHTDTGEVLGTAVRATHTLCLGLWKQGLLQDQALDYVGKAELIDFDIPLADIQVVLENSPSTKRITKTTALSTLPLPRPPVTHKYKEGHLLLICGSRRYSGGAILTGLGARASGVGMLSIAVPESLKSIMVAQLPEALIIGCPETESGAIAQLQLPAKTDLNSFSAIACGPGLTRDASPILQEVLDSISPLLLDADGLNILAEMGTINTLQKRQNSTVLTPHTGEFKRLFPEIADANQHRVKATREAAAQSGAVVLLKGARTVIANSQGTVWINPESTPALARGGSGDVLTGLIGGLLAQASSKKISVEEIVATGAWWHSQAAILAAQERTELGVDAHTLTNYLIAVLVSTSNKK
ncbi:bifunctional ADP-dependent NAD(P)H-hydrate dehydratase/NAD(P)H-hydrate epimerase [Brasilonema octagenarum UFV-E1]|uniref:Bifunctional NAD(P)H-hydrate repair enzyme n=1 Tax=Brasilonema sennae CENA114 TaxID=415709 RepID=A0A856MNY5_9CYAN|nr:NAD(P)H-hydrate dehydratase [Brasilonema sennae]QDL10987.1 bifunctional ADP-dependent NAD(P)H-hydrate dehydratase/NAD(P)H-hydrate epimerase [Brasilonema sennae CENA114]QDL17333.1 bifunctional ADP-dependent NAD(P)H-hydrate dehydratase/NAD(P)H-hydrate epimerase [Brasilonema octagenarum UFV-E1]